MLLFQSTHAPGALPEQQALDETLSMPALTEHSRGTVLIVLRLPHTGTSSSGEEEATQSAAHFAQRTRCVVLLPHGAPGEPVSGPALLGHHHLLPSAQVIEAVIEDVGLKQRIFADLERLCRPDAILSTNTSTIDISLIGAKTRAADRIVGAHFFSPAHIMPLLEIVRTDQTSPQVRPPTEFPRCHQILSAERADHG